MKIQYQINKKGENNLKKKKKKSQQTSLQSSAEGL